MTRRGTTSKVLVATARGSSNFATARRSGFAAASASSTTSLQLGHQTTLWLAARITARSWFAAWSWSWLAASRSWRWFAASRSWFTAWSCFAASRSAASASGTTSFQLGHQTTFWLAARITRDFTATAWSCSNFTTTSSSIATEQECIGANWCKAQSCDNNGQSGLDRHLEVLPRKKRNFGAYAAVLEATSTAVWVIGRNVVGHGHVRMPSDILSRHFSTPSISPD